ALPVGAAGALTPATLAIRSVGKPATNTVVGAVTGGVTGLLAAVRVKVSASRRIRPVPPAPPFWQPSTPLPVATGPTAVSAPLPVTVVAIKRIAPPLPL